jgi:hypothetical protein
MAVDYYSKYLKYKSKYLELKKQLGSARRGKCGYCRYCSEFEPKSNGKCECGHGELDHDLIL